MAQVRTGAFDPLYGGPRDIREEMIDKAARIRELITGLMDGKVPVDLPWTDPHFQKSLIASLQHYAHEAKRFEHFREAIKIIKAIT